MGKHPYSFYLFALVTGIFLYPCIPVSRYLLLFLLSVFVCISVSIVFIMRFQQLFSVLSLGIWCITGLILIDINTYIPENHYTHFEEKGKIQLLTVQLKDRNNSNEKNRKYIAEVKAVSYKDKRVHTSGKILLLVDKTKVDSALTLGNEYKVYARIRNTSSALNPHQFDYGKYLERKYILRTGTVETILSSSAHSSLWYKVKNFNQIVSQKVDQSLLSENSKEFLKAFLLGDRSEMKKDNIEAYSRSGIMHLIAISGMHIGFIFGIVFGIISFLLGGKNRRLIIIGSLLFVWLFGCFVGFSSSVFRSCLMITIFYGFELVKRIPNIYHSLSLSAILILLCNPYEIYSIGFQLSYVAVFFMSWLGSLTFKHLKTGRKKTDTWLVKPLSVTLVAQLGTLPFVLYYFHQFSLLSLAANIIIIPYTFVITYSSLIELALIFFPESMQIHFSLFYDFLINLLIESTHWISSVEFFLFRNIALNTLQLILLIFAIVLVRYFLNKPRLKTIFPVLFCLVLFQMSRLWVEYITLKKENMIVFNHKNPVIGFREGKNLLVMKGENEDMEKLKTFVIYPYVREERIAWIEYKTIDMQNVYSWKSKKVQVLSKDFSILSDSVNYVIVTGKPEIKMKEKPIKEVILIGYSDSDYVKGLKSDNPEINFRLVKEEGAFIAAH